MRVKLLRKNAKIPTRGSDQAAGLDLYASGYNVVPRGKSSKIKTGIAVAVGPGNVGLIWPRSKISSKFNIDVLAGVIDADYRGEVVVCLINHGDSDFEIEPGDKIAQMIVQRIDESRVILVDDLGGTERGEQGIKCDDLRLRDED